MHLQERACPRTQHSLLTDSRASPLLRADVRTIRVFRPLSARHIAPRLFVIQVRHIPLYSSPGVGQTVAGKTGSESISGVEAFQSPSLTDVEVGSDPFSWRKVRAPQGRVPGNAWEARAYGKCHRKYTAGATVTVRVKWCGKSAPRVWQQTWQGKPHPEQDQIGERSCGPHGSRVGCLRCTVTCIPEEWLSTTEPGLPAGSFL